VGEKKKDPISKLIGFIDSRVGFTNTFLKPLPVTGLNPFAWLGALAVLAFFAQGATGVLMMLYYVPNPDSAYQSTTQVMTKIPMGSVIETFHLYMAYAMILIVFLHLMRNYFTSVGKKPRELMWVVGFVMGVLTLAQGLTGYLLPWSVLSKAATDVFIGTLQSLPPQLFLPVKYLLEGTGSDAQELMHFYVFHTVVIPFTLLLLIVLKLYMYEIHGHAETGSVDTEGKVKKVPFFWDETWYVLMIGSAFVAVVLVLASIFPLKLPPQYSAAAAANVIVQPDWYFLWIYQVLKFSMFVGANEPVALAVVTLIFILLLLVPFIDRNKERVATRRPIYTTIGAIFIAEVIVLTIWGYATPGVNAPTSQVVEIVGGTALLVGAIFLLYFKARQALTREVVQMPTVSSSVRFLKIPFKHSRYTLLFLVLLGVASVSLSTVVSTATSPGIDYEWLLVSTLVFGVSLYSMLKLLRALVLGYEAGRGNVR